MKKRSSGILLHVTSLPSKYGIGDFGPGAYRFIDFLKKSGQRYWQILPLNPTDLALGNSPYASFSAFAGNPLFINPDALVQEGLIDKIEKTCCEDFCSDRVCYPSVISQKQKLLEKIFLYNQFRIKENKEFQEFERENQDWLDDFSLFISMKKAFSGSAWTQWPEDVRLRKTSALEKVKDKYSEEVLRAKFFQFLFFKQWEQLKTYAHNQGIYIIGDLPFYVQHDSVDTWAKQSFFKLDEKGNALGLAGVPPDYFSSTGQLWGNPVYRWEALALERYQWWKDRLRQNFKFFDFLRIDHFRGFVDFWEIPQGAKNAVKGRWVKVPAEDFFDELVKTFDPFPVIAEDLGIITDEVKRIIQKYKFPGMKILAFAFDGKSDNPYLPENYIENCIVYTGTHDNNTTQGWFKREVSDQMKAFIEKSLKEEPQADKIHWQLIELAMRSLANTAIIPMQDTLGLNETHRMNLPSTAEGNWEWRLASSQLTDTLAQKLFSITKASSRL